MHMHNFNEILGKYFDDADQREILITARNLSENPTSDLVLAIAMRKMCERIENLEKRIALEFDRENCSRDV